MFFFLQQAAAEGESGQSNEAPVDDRWISDNCFLEPKELLTRIKHKSLKERTKLDTTMCQDVSGVVPSARICAVSQHLPSLHVG